MATMMLRLQRGCHNINLVSPSHVVPKCSGCGDRPNAA